MLSQHCFFIDDKGSGSQLLCPQIYTPIATSQGNDGESDDSICIGRALFYKYKRYKNRLIVVISHLIKIKKYKYIYNFI